MKRIKAWFLVLIMVFSLCSFLVGCTATGEDSALSMGQWLELLCNSFGMTTYTEQEPFFAKVGIGNSYFSVFQACAEWDILEPSDTVDANTSVTWNDVLVTLVNAGEFMDIEASDEEKIAYAIEHFDSSIRSYWGGRYIKMSEAVTLLETAQSQWVNSRYDDTIEVLAVNEEVKDYLEEELDYTVDEDDVVTVSGGELADLQPGDVYTLPGNDSANASINRVASIEVVDGQTVITNDETFTEEEALEYIEEFQLQETSDVDFGQLAGIYDENGNPVDFTVNPNEDLLAEMGIGENAYVAPLFSSAAENTAASNLGLFDYVKGTMEFKIPDTDWKVKLTIKKSSVAIKLTKEKTVSDSLKRKVKQEAYVQVGFSNMQITRDVDYSWGKLKSATMKLTYKTEIETGVTFGKSEKIGKENLVPDTWKTFSKTAVSDIKDALSQYKSAITTATDPWRDGSQKQSDSIYICRLNLLGSSKTVGLDFIIKGEVTITGEVKITITVSGASGIEYKNNKIRYINKSTTDVNLVADGKMEATITPGFELRLLSKILVVDLTCRLGMGASFTVTTHLLDAEGHRLYSGKASLSGESAEAFAEYGDIVLTKSELQEYLIEQGIQWDAKDESPTEITFCPGFCFDWRVYPIVTIGAGSKTSLVGKILSKLNIEFEYKAFDENDVILGGHYDFPGYNPIESALDGDWAAALGLWQECTLKNEPWPEGDAFTEEDVTAETTTAVNDYDVSDRIKLASVRLFMEVGETQYLEVTALPSGYTLDDLEAVVDDTKIIQFDAEFSKLTAVGEGTTQVIVRTKDKKFKVDMAITVSEASESAYSGFEDGFVFCGSTGGPY